MYNSTATRPDSSKIFILREIETLNIERERRETDVGSEISSVFDQTHSDKTTLGTAQQIYDLGLTRD